MNAKYLTSMPENYLENRILWYSPRYLEFCYANDGSGLGTHHIVLSKDGGTDDSFNIVHLSVENHKRAHEIMWEDNQNGSREARQLAQRAYSVTRGLGHPSTEEGRCKMRLAKLGKPHYQSQETKQNISKSLTGRKLSEEHKMATSKGVKRLWENQEYRDKVSKSLKNRSNKLWDRVCRRCGANFQSHACNARYCDDCR